MRHILVYQTMCGDRRRLMSSPLLVSSQYCTPVPVLSGRMVKPTESALPPAMTWRSFSHVLPSRATFLLSFLFFFFCMMVCWDVSPVASRQNSCRSFGTRARLILAASARAGELAG